MRKAAALLAALFLLTGCAARQQPAPAPQPTEAPAPLSLPAEKASAAGCEAMPMTMDGLLLAKAWYRNGCCYVPVRALCAFFDREMSWSGDADSFSLHIDNLSVRGTRGQEYYTAAGRYVWAPEDWLVREGELYLPSRAVQKLLHLDAVFDESGAIAFSSANMLLLTGGADYYELNFPTDDVYWLAHIINAEAKSEPLDGQIGVGNVVMNRVESELFPSTVFEVIYDTEHTIQFEPIALGGIREDPGETSMIAAYLVLEGANTVGDSLYFVNPAYGSYWFDSALELTAVIGHHNFYTDKGE